MSAMRPMHPHRHRGRAAPAFLAACLAAGALAAPACSREKAPSSPVIRIVSAEALAQTLREHRGQWTVVNFWATWCPPCREEMPDLIAFFEKRKDRNVAFVSVSVDHPDTVDRAVRPYAAEALLPFDVFVLDAEPSGELPARLGLPIAWDGNVPMTLLLRPDGAIACTWDDIVTAQTLEQALDAS